MVDDTSDDFTTVFMNSEKMVALGVASGDTVMLKGKKRTSTVATVQEDDTVGEGKIQLSKTLRSNLRLKLGDIVKVNLVKPDEIKKASKIVCAPFKDTTEGITGDIFDVFLRPHFKDREVPLKKGDIFMVRGGMRVVEFKVVSVEVDGDDDAEFGVYFADTLLEMEEEHLGREEDERISSIGYDDVGGCNRQLAQIRELVELPLRHPQIFRTVGIPPPRGVLMYGPPGSGKTLIAKAVAAETGANFVLINGPEVMSKMAGESESNLRKV